MLRAAGRPTAALRRSPRGCPRLAPSAKKGGADEEAPKHKDKDKDKDKKKQRSASGEGNGDGAVAVLPQPAAAVALPATQRLTGNNLFDATKPARLEVSPEVLARVAARAQHNFIYDTSLGLLQIELVKLQESVKRHGQKVAVIFEGRDAAGKGGVISRISSAMSPRICRVVALPAPTEREKGQWYFARYAAQLPAAGEVVLFDRSWYNRAGVEKVMGFCTDAEHERFLVEAPHFERSLASAGIQILKLYLDVSDDEQERRFKDRVKRTFKRWKLSPMDICARSRWVAYSRARDEMLSRTDHEWGRWHVLDSDDKHVSQLNALSFILASVPYDDVELPELELPPREVDASYSPPPREAWRRVPPVYTRDNLVVPTALRLRAASLMVLRDAEAVEAELDVPTPE